MSPNLGNELKKLKTYIVHLCPRSLKARCNAVVVRRRVNMCRTDAISMICKELYFLLAQRTKADSGNTPKRTEQELSI